MVIHKPPPPRLEQSDSEEGKDCIFRWLNKNQRSRSTDELVKFLQDSTYVSLVMTNDGMTRILDEYRHNVQKISVIF